ncbi:MAG TPA: RNase H family protein [Gemmatimonadales bacterium]|nr:RNase H family protein [Gemmatimonadales bacterium]
MSGPVAVLHLDESCLGNGREGENPGGGGALIEVRSRNGVVQRRDYYLHEPATTNNRMALKGAAFVLDLLAAKGTRLDVLMVSDSQYLVRGMREWVEGWKARGWTRKGGPIENLELWKRLDLARRKHAVQWTWLRGHDKHPKNEYADRLAVRAAREQRSTEGAVESGFDDWLATEREKGLYVGYDPDAAFARLEARVTKGERFPLVLVEQVA